MVSPELLRRFPFFAGLDGEGLKAIAMITDTVALEPGATVFEADMVADALFILVDGNVDLHYLIVDREDPKVRKDYFVAEIDPGELFGLSGLVEPHKFTLTARVTTPAHVIRIQAAPLRALCEENCRLGYRLLQQVAKATLVRLDETRVQLVAARA
jgi:CRP/FNR family transcriptional regulator, cyclic AMP receptor protein